MHKNGTTHRKRPNISGEFISKETGTNDRGVNRMNALGDYMAMLQARLRRVRVVCGDWSRIMGPSVTYKIGTTAIFLDPPYEGNLRADGLYAVDDGAVSAEVRNWCLEEIEDERGGFCGPRYQHPKLRIALCGYEDEHGPYMPDDWEMIAWKANGGYANQRKNDTQNNNAHEERIWFSPACLKPADTVRNWWVS